MKSNISNVAQIVIFTLVIVGGVFLFQDDVRSKFFAGKSPDIQTELQRSAELSLKEDVKVDSTITDAEVVVTTNSPSEKSVATTQSIGLADTGAFVSTIDFFTLKGNPELNKQECKSGYCYEVSTADYQSTSDDILHIEIKKVLSSSLEITSPDTLENTLKKIQQFSEFGKSYLSNCATAEELVCISADAKYGIVISHSNSFLVKEEYRDAATSNLSEEVYKKWQREYISTNEVIRYFVNKYTPAESATSPVVQKNTQEISGANNEVVVYGEQIDMNPYGMGSIEPGTKNAVIGTYKLRAATSEDVLISKFNFHIRNNSDNGDGGPMQGATMSNFRVKISGIEYKVTTTTDPIMFGITGKTSLTSKAIIPKGTTVDAIIYADIGTNIHPYPATFDLSSSQFDVGFQGLTSGTTLKSSSPNSDSDETFKKYYWSGYIKVSYQ